MASVADSGRAASARSHALNTMWGFANGTLTIIQLTVMVLAVWVIYTYVWTVEHAQPLVRLDANEHLRGRG